MPSRRLSVAALMVLAAPLAACLDYAPSVHPLFAPADGVEVPIAGEWVDQENGDVRITFTARPAGYELWVAGKGCADDECLSKVDVRFGRIAGQLFADFIATESEVRIGTAPMHAFARVRLDRDTLELAVLESEWLLAAVQKKPASIAHEIADERVVLTAKTAALQQGMAEWMRDEKAFDDAIRFVRRPAGGRS